jgi:hypothetical protein
MHAIRGVTVGGNREKKGERSFDDEYFWKTRFCSYHLKLLDRSIR